MRSPHSKLERIELREVSLVARDAAGPSRRIAGPKPAGPSPDGFEPAPGCSWVIAPRRAGLGDWAGSGSGDRGDVACDILRSKSGSLVIYLAYRSRTEVGNYPEPIPEYRPVVFDARRHRGDIPLRSFVHAQPTPATVVHTSETTVMRFEHLADSPRTFPLRPGALRMSEIAFIGVERLNPETFATPASAPLSRRWRKEVVVPPDARGAISLRPADHVGRI